MMDIPLVVDLDGTLTPTDTLVEGTVKLIRQSPKYLLWLPIWLLRGRAGFKSSLAEHAGVSAHLLPYNEPFLAWLRVEKLRGRRIVLATAAHQTVADGVARHLGLFDEVIATTPGSNLKGEAKLRAIRRLVGDDFLYAGDSSADLPIWKASGKAILVGADGRTGKAARAAATVEREFGLSLQPPPKLRLWLRALRVHQWLKNLLLFVPLLTAFSFLEPAKIWPLLLAFLSFSLAASATYIVNDLWDLESDRHHPRKRFRPFASAELPILQGLAVAGLALAAALGLAAAVSPHFLLILMVYLLLTSSYSWVLKRYALIDVLMLSVLYTLRIQAGTVTLQVPTSSWLLAFSVFIFLSLALVKRCSELVLLAQEQREATQGRDYRVSDLAVLWPLGVGAALSAVVVLGLFISAPETQARYLSPNLLWLAAFGLIYWQAHMWIKTTRGEMHDDPVIFAIRDRGSRMTVLAIVGVVLAARFLALPV
ncbi:UbiA family prenyltransferase [Pseudoduganella sp. LjRoot289]|uniref:UbiA family prenyltransferase n=1 Tax=Pseudoduganella sp. LjRoot289 TaxID=3342314 RepID=UPI003ED0E795